MTQREHLNALCMEMIAHDRGDPKRIQHFLKVNAFAGLIGRAEGVDEHTLFLLEAAGYIHDIGIRLAEERYGYQNGQLQQELGPAAARDMLQRYGFQTEDVERICWLVAHHHTYAGIDSADWQILVEADFLVNLYEKQADRHTIESVGKNIFRTRTGKRLLDTIFEERSKEKIH